MSQVRIVTDSSAELDPSVAVELGITVIPLDICRGADTITDDPCFCSGDFFHQVVKNREHLCVRPPAAQRFETAYRRLSHETSDIVSLHLSSAMNPTVSAACQARDQLLGRVDIRVIDTRFVSHALGYIVTQTAKTAARGASLDDVVKYARDLISRTYYAFAVPTPEALKNSGIYQETYNFGVNGGRHILPLLTLEDGVITPQFQMRSRGPIVDRLTEFVTEFTEWEHLSLVHTSLNPEVKAFRERLSEVANSKQFTEHVYGPVWGSIVGPQAMGAVIVAP